MRPYLLHHLLEESASRTPDKEAVRSGEESLSYARLAERARAGAAHLTGTLGIPEGSRLGILAEKGLAQTALIFSASMAGLPFVLIHDQLKESQVAHILGDCGIERLIATPRTRAAAEAAAGGPERVTMAEEVLAGSPGTAVSSQAITDDPATIFYTSGSTGRPKGIVVTHRNLLDGVDSVSEYLGITAEDRLIGLLPFNFDYGLNQLSCAVAAGASIVLHQFFTPVPMLRLLAREGITGLAAIPTVWAAVFNPKLADWDKLGSELDFSHLRYITNSGGKLPVPTVRRIRQTFPRTKLFLMYGLTEAFRSTYLDPDQVDIRPDSIGKAIPNVQVEVVREDGSVCAPGETGELIHRGALIARGYWNNPEKTAEVYRPNPLLPPENRFLETVVYSGDLVRKDEEGYLYYVGRKDNMIKISGFRVSPTEVEELLAASGLAAESVVFGVPDDELGYRIRAVVVFKGEPDAPALLEYCKRSAPGYLVPREVIPVPSFPKTASGKTDRPAVIREHGSDV